MATNRTGTANWKRITAQARRKAQREGTTHCPRCQVPLDYTQGQSRPNSAEVDHIIPVAQGGTDRLSNTRILCRTCNRALGALLMHAKKGATRRTTPQGKPRPITKVSYSHSAIW